MLSYWCPHARDVDKNVKIFIELSRKVFGKVLTNIKCGIYKQ